MVRRWPSEIPVVKNLLLIVALVVVAYFAWDHFKPPTLAGRPIPDEDRVAYLAATGPVSVSDNLEKDRWTLILFTATSSVESDAVERRMERAVRERVKTVHLVILNVGNLDSVASVGLKLEKLPTAWLFDGYRQRMDDVEQILKLLGA